MNTKYKQYLKSEHWISLRAKKRKLANNHCAVCGSTGPLDTHHVMYLNLVDVKPMHLRLVCKRCHGAIHQLKAMGRLRFKKKNPNSQWAGTVAQLRSVFGIYFKHPIALRQTNISVQYTRTCS